MYDFFIFQIERYVSHIEQNMILFNIIYPVVFVNIIYSVLSKVNLNLTQKEQTKCFITTNVIFVFFSYSILNIKFVFSNSNLSKFKFKF